jgi:nitroimidazol reductase NimA-like FMN-containing flavoprotein (pyridoxamine 5'-phosphate oxidase superfamily)
MKFLTSGRPKLLRLAVIHPKENRPHVSSVWYLFDGEKFWISTSLDRLKTKAIRKNPKVAMIVDTDIIPYKGVIIEGVAKLTRRNVKKITLQIVKKYVEKKYVSEQFRSLMRAPRILIEIRPLKAYDIMSYREH